MAAHVVQTHLMSSFNGMYMEATCDCSCVLAAYDDGTE